ncbi:GNAT family N-acetyltransferase [Klenkia taihuensis]|uniref:Protein N-acetyltransferase, RimJ/RimL family n=1 Tax=Klenkia taihuensis TaxID=1225127 RepID=A0A1I1S0Q1_9ACTN|nr:GNAT family N-acetyltransferase [Klenkia taihuensis]GHE13769.1 N-acetyltransferase [Klenkia taihuensis]SFD40164.1 Protein N-acetyltransferase, RimJ/RimL family [Klenkia taihuensis]
MTPLPPWPTEPPRCGPVALRPFRDDDLAAVRELAADLYVPLIGSLPAHADDAQARAWITRQHDRWTTGAGFSVAATDLDDRMVGTVGLHLRDLGEGRATAGYAVLPSRRGHGYAAAALTALTAFAWTIAGLHRVALHVEPWNTASVRTAEAAGYSREGLLRSHTEIGGTGRDMVLYAAVR